MRYFSCLFVNRPQLIGELLWFVVVFRSYAVRRCIKTIRLSELVWHSIGLYNHNGLSAEKGQRKNP